MIHRPSVLPALAMALACSACAHGPKPAAAEVLPTERAADVRTKLYADCAGAAVQAGTVTRFGSYVRFTCAGAPAKALYDAAETFSRMRGLEVTTDRRTTRHFSTIAWDDQCWSDRDPATGEAVYGCLTDQPVARDFMNGKDVPDHKK